MKFTAYIKERKTKRSAHEIFYATYKQDFMFVR